MKISKIKSNLVLMAIGLCSFFYVLSACSVNKEFQVTQEDSDKFFKRGADFVSLEDLQAGSKLYVLKCGNCHNLILPSKYTGAEWEKEYLAREFAKAQVEDDKEKKQITGFIMAKAKKVVK